MYLSQWTFNFDLEVDIPSIVSIWVHLPHLPLDCSRDDTLKIIGVSIHKYINKLEPKSTLFDCARIYVEVDLEKGIT